jgi:hypothetical protein
MIISKITNFPPLMNQRKTKENSKILKDLLKVLYSAVTNNK